MVNRIMTRVARVAADTPDTPEQLQSAVFAVVLGLLMIALGVTLLL